MATRIKGRIVRLQELTSGEWMSVTNERSGQLKITTQLVAGVGDNGGVSNNAQLTDWNAQAVVLFNKASQMRAVWNAIGVSKKWRIITEDGVAYEGNAILCKLSLRAGVKNLVTMTIGIVGDGKLERTNL